MSTAPPVSEAADATSASATTTAPPRESGSNDRVQSTIYVGNLFFETDVAKLREIFGTYGEIKSVSVATDSRGLSRG
jgi:RNA recognition motif-containing protein